MLAKLVVCLCRRFDDSAEQNTDIYTACIVTMQVKPITKRIQQECEMTRIARYMITV